MVVSPTYTMLADSSLRSFMDHLAFLGRPFREMKSRNAVELANGATIFAGDPGRTYFPREAFRQVAEYAVETTTEIENHPVKAARVWTL